MKTVYYVAYGSNLNLDKFLERCPSAKLLGGSLLSGFTLAFKGDEDGYSYLTLEEENMSTVPIGIFEIDYHDISKLDSYEGFPILYSKRHLDITFQGKIINAMTYIMNARFDYHLPSVQYFKDCLHGYQYFKFDNDYLLNAVKRTENKKLENGGARK